MDYSFRATAQESLEELDKEEAVEVIGAIEEVAEQGFGHESVKLIKERDGGWVYRIKVDNKNTNHRVFIDFIDGELKVLDILHRSNAYEKEYRNR